MRLAFPGPPVSIASVSPANSTVPWFKRLARHPIFPVLVFIVACKALGEFYPFSPFSMYSNPTTRPLRYYYVANEQGEPLPILPHTGTSPASITKNFNRIRHELIEQAPNQTDTEVRAAAAASVLEQLRQQSFKRKGRELTQVIQLIEVAIGFDESGSGLKETPLKVGEIPATLLPVP